MMSRNNNLGLSIACHVIEKRSNAGGVEKSSAA
jgi:hypothetical protein